MYGSLQEMADAVNAEYRRLPRDGDILLAGRRIPASRCVFHQIPSRAPGTLACIDGGSAPVLQTPAFTGTLNRLACSVFRGPERQRGPAFRTAQFLSLMRRSGDGYKFSLYGSGELLPDVRSLEREAADYTRDGGEAARLMSLPRAVGEWMMALEAARRLNSGDYIVMDGSLSVYGRARRGMARDAVAEARKRGVILCGLSKTSGIMTDGGMPLLDRLRERYGFAGTWYVDIGEPPRHPKPGDFHVMVAKLHASSKWLYRVDVDAAAYRSGGGAGDLAAALAANSGDAFFPGYPYGLAHADRYAQVRNDEAKAVAARLHMMLQDGPRHLSYMNAQHDYLNRVTG